MAAARSEAQQSERQISAKRRIDSDDESTYKHRKPNSARTLVHARAIASVRARRRKCNYLIAVLPGMPNKLSETLRPSGSPTCISGTKVIANVKFTDAGSNSLCKVDKSLVCKGFWESIGEVGRVCLPRRSGKTYNLTQLLLFFSMSPGLDYLEAMPDSVISGDGGLGAGAVPEMDVVALCCKKRECLFKDSGLGDDVPQVPL
ncbi:hypothetical protein GGI20_003487, partial [Coemansia sp. BCRC 34301]